MSQNLWRCFHCRQSQRHGQTVVEDLNTPQTLGDPVYKGLTSADTVGKAGWFAVAKQLPDSIAVDVQSQDAMIRRRTASADMSRLRSG